MLHAIGEEAAQWGWRILSWTRGSGGHYKVRITDGTRAALVTVAFSPRSEARSLHNLKSNVRHAIFEADRV
jgi:hypothetical protein